MAVEMLRQWISPQYLTLEMVEKVARAFKEQHAIQLHQFLLPSRLRQLKRELSLWKHHYEPQSHSFSHTALPPSFAQLISSPAFLSYLELVTGYNRLILDGALKLSHRDYIMLSHASSKRQLRFALSLTSATPKSGGVLTYKQPDGDVLEITPNENTLALVLSGPELQEYISYVNHHTKRPVLYLMASAPYKRSRR